jgi:hypothetical protein
LETPSSHRVWRRHKLAVVAERLDMLRDGFLDFSPNLISRITAGCAAGKIGHVG